MVNQKRKAYIIGAGMSGLATGSSLQERGFEVTVFEKESFIGGASQSFSWGEFPYLDVGPHIYHTPEDSLVAEWKARFGDLFHEGKFWSKNVQGKNFDEYYDYPLSLETIHGFPPQLREQVQGELRELDEVKRSKATSFYEYVRELIGPTLTEMFFIKYPQKLWGISVHEMTANWAPKRIQLTKKRMPFHAKQWSAVGKYGSGKILERIAKSFTDAGGKILFQKALTAIEREGHLIKKLVFNHQEEIFISPDDIVVSTMPIHVLAQLLGVPNTLRFRGARLVFIALNKAEAIEGESCFLYYDAPDILFHRVSEQKKFCAHGFPKDKTVLSAEVAFSEDDKTPWAEDALIQRVINDLERVHLIKKEEAYDAKIISLPYVYPFLSKEAEPEFVRVLSRLQFFKQLYLIGTGGEFHYADLQILYTKGRDLAQRLAGSFVPESQEMLKKQVIKRFNQEVRLGSRLVSKDTPPFIVAEIGLNHNGNVSVARELIDRAVEAGCSAVKFQTYHTESRISKKIKANKYAEELIDTEESLSTMFRRFELSPEDLKELFAYASAKGIEVFSTPFDLESFQLLEELGCKFYKISSMDVVNLPLIKAVAESGKPIIMSTGMSTLGQVEDAVNVVKEAGNPNLILLHCVSSYPADLASMNLNAIRTLRNVFGVQVGFSDHTIGITAATIAFALGIRVLERHFTLNRFMEGPDHILSSEPEEMKEIVRLSQLVPHALGSGEKVILESEAETINKFKKCLFAKTDIRRGDVITLDKITIKGPGGGILPKYLDHVVGRVACADIEADYPIMWEFI